MRFDCQKTLHISSRHQVEKFTNPNRVISHSPITSLIRKIYNINKDKKLHCYYNNQQTTGEIPQVDLGGWNVTITKVERAYHYQSRESLPLPK